ncbi:MAG: hypothetical protein K2I08_02340 [Muribaculaceae bacterium]|nr:hypothetical protein [Muribaculaceae bacterium]
MKRHILLIFITAFLLSACSLVNEPYQDCPEVKADEAITLYFEMNASGVSTRTDDQDHSEVESEFRQLEDGIDYKDLGMFVFARMASKPDDGEKLVLKITDINSSANQKIQINGTPGAYTVSFEVLRSELNEILFGKDSEEEITNNGKDNIIFRILIVANATPTLDDGNDPWDSIDGTTFDAVIAQLNEWDYNMDNLYDNSYEGEDVEGLYSKGNKSIPMFGTNYFSVSQNTLFNSRPEYRIMLGQIDLLRALAKVRVVDNIQNKGDDGYPKITKVEFIGSQNGAKPLPNDASKYVNGNQVHIPNIFKPDNTLTTDNMVTYRLGVMPEDMTSISPDDRKGSVLVGFIPEQVIGNVANVGGIPGFKITIEYFEGETKDFVVPMYGYNGKPFEFGDNILRNHIYTLSVEKVENEADITLVAIEAPYNSVELKPEFGELYDPEVTEE